MIDPAQYLGEPPQRIEVPAGCVVHAEAGTPLQSANQGTDAARVYVYGEQRAELLDPVV